MKQLAAVAVVFCSTAAMPAIAASTPSILPASIIAGPDTPVAWPFALGFLGVVVLRRTRSGPMI